MSCLSSQVSPVFSSTPEFLSSFLSQICPCGVQLSPVPQQCSLDIDEHDPCADPWSCGEARARFTPCSTNVMPVTSLASVCTRWNHCSHVWYMQLHWLMHCFIQLDVWEWRWVILYLRAWHSCRDNPGLESCICPGRVWRDGILHPFLSSSDSVLLPSVEHQKTFWFCLWKGKKFFI